MRSKFDTKCSACSEAIPKGATVEPLCGSWMHPGCKSQELARRLSEGRTTALSTSRWAVDQGNFGEGVARPKVGHTRGIRKIG